MLHFLLPGSVPPPQGTAPGGYGYNQEPKNYTNNFSTNTDDSETTVRDSFGDVGSFSDKAIRRGFIRKVRFNIDLCLVGHGVILNSKRHIDLRSASVNMIKLTVQ